MERTRVYPDNPYREPDAEIYQAGSEPKGSVVRFEYETRDHRSGDPTVYKKSALVYLPAGFDKQKKYDILYLMHGGSDSPEWYLGGEGSESEITHMLDKLIASGEIKPFIICAVSYYEGYCEDHVSNCVNFYLELMNDIVPKFETEYPAYSENVTPEGLRASRMHRAMGGFSMGAVTTWSVFMNRMEYFGYYLPMSGDCWVKEIKGGGSQPEATAKALEDAVKAQGFGKEDFIIYAGAGEKDIAEPNLAPQAEAMKKLGTFVWADNFKDGNFFKVTVEGGWHDVHSVKKVMYNALPKMFG